MGISLVERIKEAGIIGCGGAGFPSHVKVDARADVVIANGAECEPLLNSDQRVMEQYADELIIGLSHVMDHMNAQKGHIALKKNFHHAIETLSSRLGNTSRIELCLLDNFYPAGDEQSLLTEVTGKIVPEGGIPLNVNAVVSNVLTMIQIARAVQGNPVTAREVTLVGEVVKPQVITTPIGTPINTLLDLSIPKIPLSDIVVIDGGPMMGQIVDIDDTVNKTTSGLLFLHKDHPIIAAKTLPIAAIIRRSVAACCQCRYCTDACPRFAQGHRIEPHLMMRTLAYKTSVPTRAATGAFLCCQCGLCDYSCPMNLSPKRAFAQILKEFQGAGMENPLHAIPIAPNEFREYRKIGKDRLIRRYGLTQYDSHSLPLSKLPDPDMVRLSLNQAIGAPSVPIVQAGDTIKKADLVAKIPEGKLGANLHASISGKILEVNNNFIVIQGDR
ncbi:MAG: electron transport complex protein RnfC [Planctomycetes bacterium]|nr:electron transport complex protein RnfC [Planctomycetota bacterium]